MGINDHWLKYKYPGWVTGKLSDFCGVFYFPIFVLAFIVSIGYLVDRRQSTNAFLNKRNIFLAIAFTDFLMIVVKLSALSSRLIEEFFASYFFRISLTQDWTDLLAFIVNPLTYLYLQRFLKKNSDMPKHHKDSTD